MNIINITFSPTGSTNKVARIISAAMGKCDKEIDLTCRNLTTQSLTADDVAIIAVPSYSGRVPALVTERLKSVNGNGAKAVLITVYGNREYEDTLVELEDLAKAQGFNIIAAISAVAKHSIVNKIAAGRPDADDEMKLALFGKTIAEKLENADNSTPSVPGNRPYRKAGNGFAPKTTKNCNTCGKCARECPTGAIPLDNPKKIDKTVCIGCMRCVAICPENAKHLSPILLFLAGRMLKKPCATRKEPQLFV